MRKFLFYIIFVFTSFWLCAEEKAFIQNYNFAQKLESNHFKLASSQTSSECNFELDFNTKNLLKDDYIKIIIGNITFSGASSLLASPKLSSSISPFSVAYSQSQEIKQNTISKTSFSSPVSIFTEYEHKFKNNNLFLLNGFYSLQENEFSLCIKKQFILAQKQQTNKVLSSLIKTKKNFSIVLNFGLFNASEVKDTSWYLKKDYYREQKFPCVQFQTSYSNLKVKNLVIINSYLSPFNKVCFNFRTENQFKNKNNIFSVSAFYNPFNNYVSSSDKQIDEVFQIKLGMQNQKTINGIFNKKGLVTLLDFDLYNIQHKGKLSTGFSKSAKKYSFTNYINCVFYYDVLKNNFFIDGFSFYNKNSFYLKRITIKLNQTFVFNPDLVNSYDISKAKTSQKFSVSLQNKGNFICGLNASAEFKQTNWKLKSISPEFSFFITYKPKLKFKPELYMGYKK